jgi:hypothetical protein
MRMIQAEVLKLIRRRGLMIWSLLLTIGVVAVVEIVLTILHAVNSAHHGPAGGPDNFRGAVETVGLFGILTAVLIGATSGSQDVQNGVFRDLVVTGRSRSRLFDVRIPGAFLVWLPMVLLGFAFATVWSFIFSGDLANPSWHDIWHELAFAFAIGTVNLVMAVSLAAFVSSRIVIAVLIAWNTVISQLLIHWSSLGGARKALDLAAAQHFQPNVGPDDRIAMSTATAIIVLLIWIAVFSRAGRWWTARRDA